MYTYTYMDIKQRLYGKTIQEGYCLTWQGWKNKSGYAMVEIHGKRFKGHRLAYEAAKGPIPVGLVIDHLCRNRACLNPDHLEAVTNLENIRRGIPKNRKKIICDSGHPFDKENTTLLKDGRRRCRQCHNRLNREYKARIRNASNNIHP